MQLRPRESQRRHWDVDDVIPVQVASLPVMDRPSRTSGAVQRGSAVSTGGGVASGEQPLNAKLACDSTVPPLSVSGPMNQKVQRSVGSTTSDVPPPKVVVPVSVAPLVARSTSVNAPLDAFVSAVVGAVVLSVLTNVSAKLPLLSRPAEGRNRLLPSDGL